MGNFFEDAWDTIRDPVNAVLLSNPITAPIGASNVPGGFRPGTWLEDGRESNSQSSGESYGGGVHIEMPDYSAYYERMNQLSDEANRIATRNVEVGERMLGISEEQYDWYKQNYQPYEIELLGKAKRGIDVPYAADVAGNRVGLAFAAQRAAAGRHYERLGTNLANERLSRIRDDIALREAAATVDARNNARARTADTNRAMTTAVAAMGKGVAAESLTAFSGGAKSLADAGGSVNAGAAGLAAAMKAAAQGNADAADNYYRSQEQQAQVNAQSQHLKDVSQANYNSWLYGTIGNTVGTVAGAGLSTAMLRGSGATMDQTTANRYLAPAYRAGGRLLPPGAQ